MTQPKYRALLLVFRALLLTLAAAGCAEPARTDNEPDGEAAARAVALAVPNDNRTPGGTLRDGVLDIRLEARLAAWRPDLDVDSAVTVQAFAERGSTPQIPGPLLRAPTGTEVRLTVRNTFADSTLVVHGLRAGTVPEDTLHVPPGTTREMRFRAGAPGTYLYWGSAGHVNFSDRRGRDAQLTGAIVIDPAGARPDADERIFVMTVIDILPDTSRPPPREDIWEIAINGLSWPHTERLEYPVGETVRWRWVNGTYLPHPMHLHGFHFRVLGKGDGRADTVYAAPQVREVVTEFMPGGSTFRMDWVPRRAGNWLMHCHMVFHITPFPERPDSLRAHDAHDVAQHPLSAMAGLVLGITTVERDGAAAHRPPTPARRLRLFAQQAPADSGEAVPHGYVLQRGAEPRPDSVVVPGTPLVLTRGETAAITAVNRLRTPTTVHWHGMELESVFDGVSGWSGAGSNLAPLLAPGDSFTVAFTPPRAGTFIYHTHMDEGAQLPNGLYGPLLVLEPGERYDPTTDLVFMIGGAVENGEQGPALNGRHEPPPLTLRAGRSYRLRIVNILPQVPVEVKLLSDSVPLAWRPRSKDGAHLPPARRVEIPATLAMGVGETYDFEWTPPHPMEAILEVQVEGRKLRQVLRVQ